MAQSWVVHANLKGNVLDQTDQLTTAMAAGNSAAIEKFYRLYFEWLYQQARRATRRDEAFCLDVVQDAVLKIIRTIKRVDQERRLLAWMKLVVQSVALDLLKQETRRNNRAILATAGRSEFHETTDDAAMIEEQAVQINWLKQEIARLDPVLVQMIDMRFNKQWTLQKIGQWFGLSAGTIDGRLRRAIRMLRDKAIDEVLDEE